MSRALIGGIRPRSASPRSPSRNGGADFFPLPLRGIPRETKKPSPPSSAALRACGCGSIAPRSFDRHRGRDGRGPTNTKETHHGDHRHLHQDGQRLTPARSRPSPSTSRPRSVAAEKDNDKAPDFRIFAGTDRFGAAWKKTCKREPDYLSVKLDDPSFPAPIYASLVEAEGDDSFT